MVLNQKWAWPRENCALGTTVSTILHPPLHNLYRCTSMHKVLCFVTNISHLCFSLKWLVTEWRRPQSHNLWHNEQPHIFRPTERPPARKPKFVQGIMVEISGCMQAQKVQRLFTCLPSRVGAMPSVQCCRRNCLPLLSFIHRSVATN